METLTVKADVLSVNRKGVNNMIPILILDGKKHDIGSISWLDGKVVNVSYYHGKNDYRTIFNTDDDYMPVDLNKLIEWEEVE